MDAARKGTPRKPSEPIFLTSSKPLPRKQMMKVGPPPQKKSRSFWRVVFIILFIIFLLSLGVVTLIFFKGFTLSEHMQFENPASQSFLIGLKRLTHIFLTERGTPLLGEATGRINILLLGRAGEHYPGKNLTDTVIIMSIATDTKQVALLSLPRDLYVPIANTNFYTKINSLYQYGLSNNDGLSQLKQTVENISGVPIHYSVTIDFDGFEKIIDTLGGISLEVLRDFSDTRYPGKNYSYETFEIKKGWQKLDGPTALKYVRERHADPEGDFGRAKRQQQVLQAIKDKFFSAGTLFNIVTINRLLNTLGESVKTNMSPEDMARFLELSQTLDTKNITTVIIDAWKKESLLRVSHVQVGDIAAFNLVPRVGNFSEIQDTARNIFQQEKLRKRKQAIATEQPTLTLYVKTTENNVGEKIATFIKDELGFFHISVVPLASLNKRSDKSIIIERVGLDKPYSLDELLKRFSLTQSPAPSFLLPSRETESDFSLIVGSDLIEAFSIKETSLEQQKEDITFPELFPLQSVQPQRSSP